MVEDILGRLFGELCGRARCFVIGGEELVVCQRCLGLYVGALAAACWLMATRRWRLWRVRGWVVWLHVGLWAVVAVGGLHVVDVGPRWRLACGLWTGWLVVRWLVGAGSELRGAARGEGAGGWRTVAWEVGMMAGYAVLAWGFGWLGWLGAGVWNAAAGLGAVCLAGAVGYFGFGILGLGFGRAGRGLRRARGRLATGEHGQAELAHGTR